MFEPHSAALTGVVTLVEDGTFCLCTPSGDITPGGVLGLVHRDVRLLSQWELRIDGVVPEPRSMQQGEPFEATFEARAGQLVVARRRIVGGGGMVEDVTLRNPGPGHLAARVSIEAGSDFATIFDIKAGRAHDPGDQRAVITADREGSGLTFDATIEPRGEWRVRLTVAPGDDPVDETAPARRAAEWRASAKRFTTVDPRLAATLDRSLADLGSLRIGDTIAAGSPWYLTLFGRDSLLTSWMMLAVNPHLALGTLRALAAYQGRQLDPVTEEEPGRIPHEIRANWGPGSLRGAYYGTADATPLFVMLLGELYRRGYTAPDLVPAADRALEWITAQEFVTYRPSGGLANQGWKDSPDAVSWADGTLAEPPIALCEVQAYVYGAYRARATIARASKDDPTAHRWDERAAAFRRLFHVRFWSGDHLAYALDGSGRPVDAVTSNAAHCLWIGILDDAPAHWVAAQLTSPDMFTGWGVRTLSRRAARYDPASYHNGSVWPHDTAIAVAGLARYGFTADAERIGTALLDAAAHFDGRLPELFCGFDRSEFAAPVPYPSSCAPQAWAAAAPFLVMRSLGNPCG